jgi:ribose transport system substrate-binding protein
MRVSQRFIPRANRDDILKIENVRRKQGSCGSTLLRWHLLKYPLQVFLRAASYDMICNKLEMKKFKFLVALTTRDNDYQQEQEATAQETARRLGVDVQIIDANNDSINQSQQLLQFVQSAAGRPDAIIGWVVLNREIDYDAAELSRIRNAPVFRITSNHKEIGRIQGKQFAALLPKGGSVLYIEGPSHSSAAQQRTAGMNETKAANIQIRTLKGEWTTESAQRAVQAWLRLSTSAKAQIDLIGCQNDSMALGARDIFHELANAAERARWLSLPYTGCDGLPQGGQKWVHDGLLRATVVVPANTGLAIEMLVKTLQSNLAPPEETLTEASSYPSLALLAARSGKE